MNYTLLVDWGQTQIYLYCNPSVTGGDCCHSGLSGIALQEGFPTRFACGNDNSTVSDP